MLESLNFESERLKTGRLTGEDCLTLFYIYSDEEAMKYRGSKPLKSLEEASKMISNQFIVDKSISKLRLGIRTKSNNQLIGTLLLVNDVKLINQFEVGLSFGKEYWGRGYGQETLKMVEQKLKRYYKIEELRAWCIKENIASVKLFEKAGFLENKQSEYPGSKLFIKIINFDATTEYIKS